MLTIIDGFWGAVARDSLLLGVVLIILESHLTIFPACWILKGHSIVKLMTFWVFKFAIKICFMTTVLLKLIFQLS